MSKLSRLHAGVDLLTEPTVDAFLQAREHWSYRRSLKSAENNRNFRERSHPVFERFVAASESSEGRQAIDDYLRLSRRSKSKTLTGALKWLKDNSPHGFSLLDAPDAKTFEELRLAYRRATLVHHPDRGGTHEDMVALNEAFALLHSAMAFTDDMMSERDSFGQILKCHSFRYRVVLGLFSDAVDDWNVDGACGYLTLLKAEYGEEIRSLSRFEVRDFLSVVCRLALRLALAGRREAHAEVASVVVSFKESVAEQWRVVEPELDDSIAVLEGARRSPIKILHERQIPFLDSLGLLKTTSVASYRDRKSHVIARDSAKQSQLSAFAAGIGFIGELPSDAIAKRRSQEALMSTAARDLVPEGDYYLTETRQMTGDQAREYFTAFGAEPTLAGVRKYAHARITSLLVSTAFHPDVCWGHRETEELSLLRDIGSGSAPSYAGLAIQILQQYIAETKEEREVRALALGRIKSGRFRSAGYLRDRPLDLPLSSDGLRTFKRPIAELRELLETGVLPATHSIWPASQSRPSRNG